MTTAQGILPPDWELPQRIVRRIGQTAGRQRLMQHDGHTLLILHAVPWPDPDGRQSVFFWRKPSGEWLSSAGQSGWRALFAHVEAYRQPVDELEDKLDNLLSADDYFAALRSVTPVLRSARHMHQVLQLLRDAIDEPEAISLRDNAYEVERTGELVSTEARDGLEHAIAKRSEEEARRSGEIALSAHRLNLLMALFLPITAIGSLFGMNLPSGLENVVTPLYFWCVIGLGVTLGFGVCLWITKPGRRS